MDTFQPTDTAYRIQDVLTAIAWLHSRRDLNDRIDLVGLGAAGMWTAFAAALQEDGVGTVLADLDHFPVQDDQAWVTRYYMPCIRAIGDLMAAAAVVAVERPNSLHLFNAVQGVEPPQGVLVHWETALDDNALIAALE